MGEVDGSVDIAMTGDSGYMWPLGVAIHSLGAHADRPVNFHFAAPNDWREMISATDLDFVEGLVASLGWSYTLVECPIDAASLPRTLHIHPITFVKPALFDVAQSSRLLFIDADAIAVASWCDMGDALVDRAIAAAHEDNMGSFEAKWAPDLPAGWYFNAGMLVVDPQRWRERHSVRWRHLLNTYDEHDFVFLEQDVMNAALLGAVDLLPTRYNARPAYGDSLDDARIVHYAGWWKPWLSTRGLERHLKGAMRKSFRDYVVAERSFEEYFSKRLPPAAAEYWSAAHRRVRGTGSINAHRYHLRGRVSEAANAARSLKARVLG